MRHGKRDVGPLVMSANAYTYMYRFFFMLADDAINKSKLRKMELHALASPNGMGVNRSRVDASMSLPLPSLHWHAEGVLSVCGSLAQFVMHFRGSE